MHLSLIICISVTFLEEITQLFESVIPLHDCVVVAGDINIHTETNELYSKQFRDILDMFNMIQHVKVPTHTMGHTLDIVATYINNPVVSDIVVSEYDVSHHFLIDFSVLCTPEIREYRTINYRNIKAINNTKFSSDIREKWNTLPPGSFGTKVKNIMIC